MSGSLTEREKALATALAQARDAARAAQPGDDGGSANLDALFLNARPGLTSRTVEAAARAAGVTVRRHRSSLWRGWFVHGIGAGQGAMNTRMVEAARDALTGAGVDASVYYRVD